MLNRSVTIILVLVAGSAGSVGYWLYYESQMPGTLVMEISATWPKSNPIGMYITIGRVEVHVAGDGNETGWRAVVEGSQTIRFNPSGYESSMQSGKVSVGSYDLLRLNVTAIIIDLQETGNITYPIHGGWFVPIFSAISRGANGPVLQTPWFRMSGGSKADAWVSLSIYDYAQIIVENGYLKPFGEVLVSY
jgi:hypothetical protein